MNRLANVIEDTCGPTAKAAPGSSGSGVVLYLAQTFFTQLVCNLL